MSDDHSLLLVTHVPVRIAGNRAWIDGQTAAGIAQWCRYFSRVTYYGIAQDHAPDSSPPAGWVAADDAMFDGRLDLRALPSGYGLAGMKRHYGAVRRTLRDAIARHRHLCFTIGGLIGDWPALAAIEAKRQKRDYAAWIDVVEPSLIRAKARRGSIAKRAAAEILIPVAEAYTRHILRHSKVALLQGRDTFDHYARYAPEPHCTYDTHTHVSDRIAPEAIAAKQARIAGGAPLEIIYVGRATAMKGPFDWLATLEDLAARKVPFRATWIGNGPDLDAMQARVSQGVLAKHVDLAGFEGRHDVILRRLRESDLLLFCHQTAESARCLVEALVSGCALVGYGTGYPRGLVEQHGGGAFTAPGDPQALAAQLAALHADRDGLARLVGQAAASGELYDEDGVYAHRAGLMARA